MLQSLVGGRDVRERQGHWISIPGLLQKKAPGHSHLFASAGDGHVDFKDFLAVMTDTKRFFCSVGERGSPTGPLRAGNGIWRLMGYIEGHLRVMAATTS